VGGIFLRILGENKEIFKGRIHRYKTGETLTVDNLSFLEITVFFARSAQV